MSELQLVAPSSNLLCHILIQETGNTIESTQVWVPRQITMLSNQTNWLQCPLTGIEHNIINNLKTACVFFINWMKKSIHLIQRCAWREFTYSIFTNKLYDSQNKCLKWIQSHVYSITVFLFEQSIPLFYTIDRVEKVIFIILSCVHHIWSYTNIGQLVYFFQIFPK